MASSAPTTSGSFIPSCHALEVYVPVDLVTPPKPMSNGPRSSGSNTRASASEATIEPQTEIEISLYCRVWGVPIEQCTKKTIKVLFVHGGPGNCIMDYDNSAFFDQAGPELQESSPNNFCVIEVDQRGCGRSLPSTRAPGKPSSSIGSKFRQALDNMQLYREVSIQQLAEDFEKVRKHFFGNASDVKWLVFGGSWGSTLGLYYATAYPERCLGVIIRGVFLNTAQELDAVFTKRALEKLDPYPGNEEKSAEERETRRQYMLKEFEYLVEKAVRGGHRSPRVDGAAADAPPDEEDDGYLQNNPRALLQRYEQMVLEDQDVEAIWTWFAYEFNLMEEIGSADYKKTGPLLGSDLDGIEWIEDTGSKDLNEHYSDAGKEAFPGACSISFFEIRLFLRGAYEEPVCLLERVREMQRRACEEKDVVPVYVVQGLNDPVCPEHFGRDLVKVLSQKLQMGEGQSDEKGRKVNFGCFDLKGSYFIDAGHKAGSYGIKEQLQAVVREFAKEFEGSMS